MPATVMKLYPESASIQLEFEKIRALLHEKCRSEYARSRTASMPIHISGEIINRELKQAHEYLQLLRNAVYFPNDYVMDLRKELRLLKIGDAMLSAEQLVSIRKLLSSIESIFRWFDTERRRNWPLLAEVISGTGYEPAILKMINEVIDMDGVVRDDASAALHAIRMDIYRRRNELRRLFERIVARLNRHGFLSEIEESFMNGRRVVAVFAEHKRSVRGILHGESDSRRTSYIEPEETIELNNSISELENAERREVNRILQELTRRLSLHAPLLQKYHAITGEYDFIRAKASFAIELGGEYPLVTEKAGVHLVNAYHPLLYLYNRRAGKTTVPTDVELDERNRILVISGPNAGGKTVTLKTVGLLQMMVQAGLLVPASPASKFGIFRQLMIHIGDTQSIEFELSTYSSHLQAMKHFMETANGKTLFFIDELGSGSDPSLGGAFAEVILEELSRRHAMGIVTTHYLNLKIMAGKTPGIINGAMAFDEDNLMPQYRLVTGKPGSSYTFSIAERIGLDKRLISRARSLVDEGHFRLEKLLNRAEQDLRGIQLKEKELQKLLKENEKLRKEMEQVMDRERHRQQVELMKQQNRMTEERLAWLKDMERKLRQLVIRWKKEDDKEKVVKEIGALLLKRNEHKAVSKKQKQLDSKYQEVQGDIRVGDKVKMRRNLQVGQVLEIRGRKAVVRIGMLPMQISLEDLVLIREKE